MICVVLISFFSNLLINKQFKSFILQRQEKENKNLVESVNNQFTSAGRWNEEMISKIGQSAIEEGLFITVKDSAGNIIWDASTFNFDKCEIVKNRLTKNMLKRYPNWTAMYKTDSYDIKYNSDTVGTIEIGYYGPFYYTDTEIMYLDTLNRIVIGVGVMTLIFALILGLIMARGISRPISSVIHAAKLISKGNYNQRIAKVTDTEEIKELVETVNELGRTLHEEEILRKRITKDISHELRTPLTTLHNLMEAMIDGLWEPTPERLMSCQEEIERLKRLVGDLENLTKYESENLILNKTEFNVNTALKNIVFNFQNQFINKDVELNLHERDTVIYADKDKMSQVIINLLSNALKYTNRGGRVDIFVGEDKTHTFISVKDTGLGIAETDLPYIFERFYRTDESRNRKTGGAGIGLTIAKAIVEAHSGTIDIESKLGEGTKFIVKIPQH